MLTGLLTIPRPPLANGSIMFTLGPPSIWIPGFCLVSKIRQVAQQGWQTVEVAYELDVDSVNDWFGDRLGCFYRWPDSSPHLPQHAQHARGRGVVSRRRERAHAEGADRTDHESEPAHGPGLGLRRRLRSAAAGAGRHVHLSGIERCSVSAA